MFPIREWKKQKTERKSCFPLLYCSSAYFCQCCAVGAAVHPVQPKTLLLYESSSGKKLFIDAISVFIYYIIYEEKRIFFYLRAFNFFGILCCCSLLLLYLFIYCVIMIRFPFYFSVNTIDGQSLELCNKLEHVLHGRRK